MEANQGRYTARQPRSSPAVNGESAVAVRPPEAMLLTPDGGWMHDSDGKRRLRVRLSENILQFALNRLFCLLPGFAFTGAVYSVIGVTLSVPTATT